MKVPALVCPQLLESLNNGTSELWHIDSIELKIGGGQMRNHIFCKGIRQLNRLTLHRLLTFTGTIIVYSTAVANWQRSSNNMRRERAAKYIVIL
jgi:hypothetical protein